MVAFGLSEHVSVSVVLFVDGLVLLLFGCFIKFAVLFVVLIECVDCRIVGFVGLLLFVITVFVLFGLWLCYCMLY